METGVKSGSGDQLPDDIWIRVITSGLAQGMSVREVCSLAICSRRFRDLCDAETVWQAACSARWPPPANPPGFVQIWPQNSHPSWKETFMKRYEKERVQQKMAHERQLMRAQCKALRLKGDIDRMVSDLNGLKHKSSELRCQLHELKRARAAGTAGRGWQPRAVMRRYEQVLEQHEAPPDARILQLEQKLKDTMLQVQILSNSLAKKRQTLEAAQEEVDFLTYKPSA